MTRTLTAAFAAALLLFGSPALAQKRCERSLLGCDLSRGAPTPAPIRSTLVGAVLDLDGSDTQALELYRRLIPQDFVMPRRPQLAIYLVELQVPSELPMLPPNDLSRWIEGAVAIRVRRDGGPTEGRSLEPLGRDEEGFYPLMMPVTSRVQFETGRAVGLPKVQAQVAAREVSEDRILLATERDGETLLSIEWQAGDQEVSDDSSRLAMGRFPYFSLNPYLQGPERIRNKFSYLPALPTTLPLPVPPPTHLTQPLPGELLIRLNPAFEALDPVLAALAERVGQPYTELLQPEYRVPGVARDVQATLLIQAESLGAAASR